MNSSFVSSLFELSYSAVIVSLLYYFLTQSEKKKHSQRAMLLHWILFGFIVNLYGLSWLYTVYPLPWLEEGLTQLLAIGLLHLILSVAVAVPYAIIGFGASYKKTTTILLPFIFASTVTVAEMFRSLIISILFYGKGTTIGLHFTAGTIGNALSPTPFIEFAYIGGTFGLTFILGYLVYILYTKNNFALYWKHGAGILLILILIHFCVPVRLPQEKTAVGIITTNFTLPEKKENYGGTFKAQEKIIHTMTLSLASSSPSIIAYPEDTRYLSYLSPTDKTDLLIHFNKTLFIDGETVPVQGGLSNTSVFYIPRTAKPLVRGKEFLLPFSEYIPYVFSPLLEVFVGNNNMKMYTDEHTYTPIHSSKTIILGSERIGTLLCSEIFSYTTVKKLNRENPSLVFFQSRMDVFHNNSWFIMHLRSFTKVAAAQMRTTIISSTSNAPSLIISPYGRVLRYIPASRTATTYTFE